MNFNKSREWKIMFKDYNIEARYNLQIHKINYIYFSKKKNNTIKM